MGQTAHFLAKNPVEWLIWVSVVFLWVGFQEIESTSAQAQESSRSLQGSFAGTRFSVDRGFYHEPFEVAVTTGTPGATLIYTTDGSPPGAGHGIMAPAPDSQTRPRLTLTISKTTTLRVIAVKPGFEPSHIDTHTYIFPEQVLQQNGRGAPFTQAVRWGHAGPDWEMDLDIVNHSNPDIRPVPEDLLRIATVSLVLDFHQMFGSNGIYIAGESVERNSSIEFINPGNDFANPNSGQGFQVDGTVQIVGGTSPNRWKSDKLSMRLKFRPDLRFPVFGITAADRFDTLVLDAGLNNVWHYGGGAEPQNQRNRAQYVRDQYAADLHNAMGGNSPHGRHVHLYINGIYWGIHTLHERPDDNFAATYLGGDNRDYDSLKHNPNDVLAGSSQNYLRLHALADRNLADDANYQAVAQLLAIDDFIQYMLVNYYIGNTDWAHQNWYASFNRVDPDGRWRFHSWDAEKGLQHVQEDTTRRNDIGGPTNLHLDLVANREYRLRFADLAYHHLRYGVLTPEHAGRMYREITDAIDLVMRLESARWGDNQRSPPYTRLNWLNIRNEIFGLTRNPGAPLFDYFNRRSNVVLQQFRNRGWLPSIAPPTFNQHGGSVSRDFLLSINTASTGTIFFTLDGSDPRIPGQGGMPSSIQPSARPYTGPFPLQQSSVVKARIKNGEEWSPLLQAFFLVDSVRPSVENLVISRIHYRPGAPNDAEISAGFTSRNEFEFLEMSNIISQTVELTGMRFVHGVHFVFQPNSAIRQLAAGQRLLLVANRAAFEMRYGRSFLVAGEFQDETNLDNGGERIAALNAEDQIIVDLTYDDEAPWPVEPDGGGYSLALRQPETNPDPSDPNNWIANPETDAHRNGMPSDSFQVWLTIHFTSSEIINSHISGLHADPDLDGLPNVLEFFHATDPKKSEDSGRLLMSVTDPVGGEHQITLSFVKRHDTRPLSWRLTESADLSSWAPVPLEGHMVTNSNLDGTQTVRFSLASEAGTSFFRLEVSTGEQP